MSLMTVLPAPTQLPQPANLTVTSARFVHQLTWAPGPGMPPGVHYKVTYVTDRCVSPLVDFPLLSAFR